MESFSFDPWGKRRAPTLADLESILGSWSTLTTYEQGNLTISASLLSSSITNKGFTGHEQLDPVGLIHMGGRVYDAEIGRFLSADPFVQDTTNLQGLNRYSYVQNNPLSYTDPSGYFLKNLIEKVASAVSKVWKAVWGEVIKPALQKIGRLFAEVPGLSAVVTAVSCVMVPASCGLVAKIMAGLNSAITIANGGTIMQATVGYAVGMVTVELGTAIGDFVKAGSDLAQSAGLAISSGIAAKAQGGKFIDGFKGVAIGMAVSWGITRTAQPAESKSSPRNASEESEGRANSSATTNPLSVALDVGGKIWALPNTIIGAIYGGMGHVVGEVGYALGLYDVSPSITFGNNAIQFLDNPFTLSNTAITLGNTISYGRGSPPSKYGAYGDPTVNIGLHEKAHTYQYQVLGPLFLPVYLGSQAVSGSGLNAFEDAAQNYGRGSGGWWPQ